MTPIDRIVTTSDGKYPNAGKTNLCPNCGGDPTIATGAKAIGTAGCTCGAVRVYNDGFPFADAEPTRVEIPEAIRASAKLDPARFVFERSEPPTRIRSDALDGRVFHASGVWLIAEAPSGTASLDEAFAQGAAKAISVTVERVGTITRAQVEAARQRNEKFKHAPVDLGGALLDAHLALDLFDAADWTNDCVLTVSVGHAKPSRARNGGPVLVDSMGVFRFDCDGVTLVCAGMQYAVPVTIEVAPC